MPDIARIQREIAAAGGWPDVPYIGRSLKIGVRGNAVVALAGRGVLKGGTSFFYK